MIMTGAEEQFFASISPFDVLSPEEIARVATPSLYHPHRRGGRVAPWLSSAPS
jgi:hypothetical protein